MIIPPFLLLAIAVLISPSLASAHPGGLDADGCHTNRKTGEYHCHPTPISALAITGTASVIDGDTIEIHGQRIRLHGIDAPESRQTCRKGGQEIRCGQQASLALADKVGRRPVTCEQRDKDRYGRIVAVCRVDGDDLNAWMVAQGHAMAYRRYSRDYVALEDVAKTAKVGIWATEFEVPWEWRKKSR